MGKRRGCQQKGKFGKYKFTYIKDWDLYICPERNYLEYVTTDRNGYREYKCKNDRCSTCPRRQECLTAKQKTKSLRRHVWEDYKDETYIFTHTEKARRYMQRERKRWKGALPIPKNYLGYAIAECVVLKRLLNSACLLQLLRI